MLTTRFSPVARMPSLVARLLPLMVLLLCLALPGSAMAAGRAPGAVTPAGQARCEEGPMLSAVRPIFLPILYGPQPAAASSNDVQVASTLPLVRPPSDGVNRTTAIPILMYHHVGPLPAGADSIRRGLTISEAAFREQLDFLKHQGYQSIALADLGMHLATGADLPEKPIVITVDDGYRDSFEVALPALLDHGLTATFFLLTAPIDEGSTEFVTWEEVRALHAAGMEIGAHSYTHMDLTGKSADYVVWQAVGSKEAIEARIGEPVRFFAYPSGAYDDNAERVVESAGFWGAVTTEPGCRQSEGGLYTLARVRVTPQDSLRSLAEKLRDCPSP